MKKKIVGILVCTLLIATALSAMGTMTEKEDNQNIGGSGEIFGQLPSPHGDPQPVGWASDLRVGWKVYEDFWDITSPICDIHWWGQTPYWDGSTWQPCEPIGMTVDITFYEDDGGEPGAIFCSYDDVIPEYTLTGIMYDYTEFPNGPFELIYFEYELNTCCNLSDGWFSIQSIDSDNDCSFCWFESPDGNDIIIQNSIQRTTDVAFIFTDGEESGIEINVKSGIGVTLEVTNSGTETLTEIPVDIIVYGGIYGKIKVHVRETINLDPGDTASVGTGVFLGLGKIAIGVIADDVVEYKQGLHLLIFTLIK